METKTSKKIQIVHAISGVFFVIAGLLTIQQRRVIFTVWVVSLGVLLLFQAFKKPLESKISRVMLEVIYFIISAVVLLSGVNVLFFD